MKKKWWFAALAFFALAIALAIAIAALLPPTPGVTYANFSRLEKGMAREQVEALLGESNLDVAEFEHLLFPRRDVAGGHSLYWCGDGGDTLTIRFDEQSHVLDTTWNGWQDDRNDLEKLRDRLPGWQKKAAKADIRLF